MPTDKTRNRILREARHMVRMEKIGDFINDYRQFFRRLRVGYYSDRLVYFNRWLVNDEQQQINDYYSKRKNRSRR